MTKPTVTIQTDYIVDIITDTQTKEEAYTSGDLVFQLVDLKEFTKKFRKYYPQSEDDPTQIWHAFFGNEPSGRLNGENKDVCYLTADSCHMILGHYQLFNTGFDFNHLPSGFFLTKNPQQGGVRDVLHYSDFLATNNPQTNPLAVILSHKEAMPNHKPHEFVPPQSYWYEFLRSKIKNNDVIYCSEKELKKAFITFSNTLTRLNLDFPIANFKEFNTAINPIVLLGRWNTVLTQANLKAIDRTVQWQALLKLNLNSGYGAMRAISDYQNTEYPCGFLVPEMFQTELRRITQFHNIRTIESAKKISSLSDFWRYISYQPKRNSIDFYKNGLAQIDKMTLTDIQKRKMWIMLAGSSTGRAHHAQTQEEELLEFNYWERLCTLVDKIATVTMTMRAISTYLGADGIKNNFIIHLERLSQLPNVPFLHSMALCIQEHIEALNMFQVPLDLGMGLDPLRHLVALSDKLNGLISHSGADFYEGARFYFINGHWAELNVQKYVELQDYLMKCMNAYTNRVFKDLYVPYLSTFNIQRNEEVDQIIRVASQTKNPSSKNLRFCLNLFKDVTQQCSLQDVLSLITEIANKPETDSLLSILDYVDTNFKDSFPEGYFTRKKQQLLDAQSGLNEEQKIAVHNLHFPEAQTQLLISIESALVRNNPTIDSPQLNQLNEQFVTLSRLISLSDFTQFLENLASIKELLPLDITILGNLLTLLSKQRSLESFRQIYYRNLIEKCPDRSLIDKFIFFIETIKAMGETLGPIASLTVQELLADLVLNCDLDTIQQRSFIAEIKEILKTIETVAVAHPHLQQYLLDAISHTSGKQTPEYFINIKKLMQCSQQINTLLHAGEDENSQQNMLFIYTLFANFYQKPMELIQLWEKITVLKQPEQQKFILGLVKNNKAVDGLELLITKLCKKPELFDLLVSECSNPPYPSINTINSWLDTEYFKEKYQAFSMRPYGKRRLDFSFNRSEFATQRTLFKGVDPELFTDELAQEIEYYLKKNRTTKIQDLQRQFLAIQKSSMPLDNTNKLALLCVCIEMLARTTAQLDDGIPPKLISQELNTTQVMAVYAKLTHPNSKLICEVDTGEGKSRMNMILAACQVAQGKTVDFMTSDMPLAERDFLTYNAFFTSLGMRTSLISLNTPKQLYQKGGINFSDNSQLLLLRNRSDIQQDPFAFLDQDPKKRCLLIDEVDKFMHDKAKDSYNYATTSKALKGFIWIYPLLVNFVHEQLKKDPNTPFDPELLARKFVDFVAIHDTDDLHQASVSTLCQNHKNQLTSWIKSAHTALHMKKDSEYKVTDASEDKLVRVRDVDGHTRYSRKILVLDNGRPVEGSTFALGVHQCLCAIENQEAGKEEFVIPPENETQRSSFPVTFMAQYDQGAIYGASGTTRYKGPTTKPEVNYEAHSYLVVPRQKTLRREDQKIWLAKDTEQQIEFIKRSLREKLSKNIPDAALLICANDEQSQLFHDMLMADEDFKSLVKKCTQVHGLTEKSDEINAIAEAGKPGVLTISTVGMFGRGVDINAANLFVVAAYVPTLEDEKQIKGRTGRAGKPGEYRMIPNLSDPDCPIKGNTHNVNYEVNKIQKSMALNAAYQEEIGKLYADFLENIHQKFLTTLSTTPQVEQLELLQTWQKYLNNLQKAWDNQRVLLVELIEQSNKKEFIDLFSHFTRDWEEKANFIKKDQAFSPQKAETVYTALLGQKGFFKPKRKEIKTQRSYDVSDDGQARVYSSLFAQELAILRGERRLFADIHAWKEGRGELFPDLMATLKGERPLFANLRATIARLIAELKAWWEQKTPEEQDAKVTIVSDDYQNGFMEDYENQTPIMV